MINWKSNWKKGFSRAFILGLITVASLFVFCAHYLLRTDAKAFFLASKERFLVRNIATNIPMLRLIKGYLASFRYAWVLLLVLAIWNVIKKRKIEMRGVLCLVMVFPVLENLIMKQHAASYSYDRMKAARILVFVICELIRNLLDDNEKRSVPIIIMVLVCLLSAFNLESYKNNEHYIWKVDYRESNQLLADYANEQYPNALYASNLWVRGYMNLLFDKGIYEFCDLTTAAKLAEDNGNDTIVYLQPDCNALGSITVYKSDLSEAVVYTVRDGQVVANDPQIICTE